jgi:hypothetical protein
MSTVDPSVADPSSGDPCVGDPCVGDPTVGDPTVADPKKFTDKSTPAVDALEVLGVLRIRAVYRVWGRRPHTRDEERDHPPA